jgi:hypothetical protein
VVFHIYSEKEVRMNTIQSKVDRGYWLAWFLASAIGYSLGAILGVSAAYRLFDRDPFDAVMGFTLGAMMGATGGYFQWVVLRERVAGAGLWWLASALGFGLAMGANEAANTGENYASTVVLLGSVFGVVGGIIQLLILRRNLARAGWWLLANFLGSLVSAIALPIAAIIGESGNWALAITTFGLVFGAGNGAITGTMLVWLLRQSHTGYIEDLATAN